METFNITDCLVLKLEENDINNNRLDNTIYIFYDKLEQTYKIRGQRECHGRCGCTYSYTCTTEFHLADYLQYVIYSKNTVNEILYNYDNFPINSDNISFEFLQEYDHSDYELSGYNDRRLKRKRLVKILQMLRNVFNNYN